MEIEFIILLIVVFFVVGYIIKDDLYESFVSMDGMTINDPILSEEQIDSMDKTIDNSDGIDRFIDGNITEQTGYNWKEGKFSLGRKGYGPRTSHNLYNFTLDPQFITRDDRLSSDALKRSTKNKDAILGAVRNTKEMTKRIFEEELQEAERADWYNDVLQDQTVDDAKFFVPNWKLPSTKSGMKRDYKY